MRRRGLFVTGTDTGVGKTWVTSKLAEHWSRTQPPGAVHPEMRPGAVDPEVRPGAVHPEVRPGAVDPEVRPGAVHPEVDPEVRPGARHPVAAIKAAESGCARGPEGLIASDDEALFRAAGGWQPERCRYRFEAAVAPGVAAEDAGAAIDFAVIAAQVQGLSEVAEMGLVEGAGGWLVPMGGGRTIEDLAVVLGLPVLVVARAGLGTINHSLLTVQAIRAAAQEAIAVALSVRPEDDRELAERNRREIERLGRLQVVIVEGDAAELAGALGSRLGLD